MNQIKILERFWKTGLAVLVSGFLFFGGLFLSLSSASASGTPHTTVRLLVNDLNDSPDQGWVHSLNSAAGHELEYAIEIHNTEVGTVAENTRVKVDFPGGTLTNMPITATAWAQNSNSATDTDTILIPAPGASISFVPGSTRLYWDKNGDGVKEFNNTPLLDGITSSNGIPLGNQSGSNEFIIQLTFLAKLAGPVIQPSPTPTPAPSVSPSPVPSPTPTPSVSPTPTPVASPSPTPVVSPSPTPTIAPSPSPTPAGGVQCPEGFNQQLSGNQIVCVQNINNNNNTNNNSNSQSQSQENNQEVNITNTVSNPTPTVLAASVPLKSPETGANVLGLFSMFSSAPLGLALARYGRGRTLLSKKEEEDGLQIISQRKNKLSH